jgi:glycine cleavage system regulatory protein
MQSFIFPANADRPKLSDLPGEARPFPCANHHAIHDAWMEPYLILTIAGLDRPGLVERVAAAVTAHGGNWLESRLIQLGGHFAGVVRVEVPVAAHAALRSDLAAMAADGLTVAAVPAAGTPATPSREVSLSVTGLDHPGIVSQIASTVARAGLNVEEFISEVTSAPMSGEPLFNASLRLTGPPSADLRALASALETLSEELMVEISLTEK